MTVAVDVRSATMRGAAIEWPSVLLCLGLYAGFVALTWFNAVLPAAVLLPAGALLVTLHSSMQHEFIHGHPTRWRRLNRLMAAVPLSLWLPFETYRRSHLVHHRDESLTDPLDDPESYYWSAADWAALGPMGRLIVRAHTTLAGRMLIGPAWTIGRFLRGEVHALRQGDRQRRLIWRGHMVAVLGLLVWLGPVCHMSPWLYGAMVYAGTAILLLRSFAEHRAQEAVIERTAIVQNAWILGPLFLFNNLHAAHHERPLMPWYRLPAWYGANRARLLAANGGLVYDGYMAVVKAFLFRPHDVIVHPGRTLADVG